MASKAQRLMNRLNPVEPTKATFKILDSIGVTGAWNVQFNPTSLRLRRDVSWAGGQEHGAWGSLQFDRGNADKLDFTLVFDESEWRPSGLLASAGSLVASTFTSAMGGTGVGGAAAAAASLLFYNEKDVLAGFKLLYACSRPLVLDDDGVVRPPLLRFEWGKNFAFVGYVDNVGADINLWEFDGTPRRVISEVSLIGRYLAFKATEGDDADPFLPDDPADTAVAVKAEMKALVAKLSGL